MRKRKSLSFSISQLLLLNSSQQHLNILKFAQEQMFYYPSQTSVDKCFFRLASGTVGFSPRLKKFWSCDNIFATLRLAKHWSRDAILAVDSLSHVFPAFVKVQRKERCPLYKILSTLAGVYAQWTNPYRLSVRVHATATPVQAVHVRTERTIVNEPAKRRCHHVFHQRRENSLVTGILVVSGCLLIFVFPVRTPAEETCI